MAGGADHVLTASPLPHTGVLPEVPAITHTQTSPRACIILESPGILQETGTNASQNLCCQHWLQLGILPQSWCLLPLALCL